MKYLKILEMRLKKNSFIRHIYNIKVNARIDAVTFSFTIMDAYIIKNYFLFQKFAS